MPRRRSTGCDSDRPNSSKEVRVVNPIGMLDLKAEFPELEAEVRAAIDGVLASQAFIGGPQIAAFESRVAERLGCAHAIAVSSGTDAILMALMAAGIGPGDEVITTPFTFFATAGCVHRLGAKPVFVDIDPRCFNIDPRRSSLRSRRGPRRSCRSTCSANARTWTPLVKLSSAMT
jgi:histidinol-phosphate/aromatic aminotransferase/cobyric acid decarboxylase-like protein